MGLLRKFTERHYFRRVIIYFLICCLIFNGALSVTLAGPEGAEVVHGQVSFQQSGLNTTIHASDKSIINYRGFDIARPEVVQFVQPSSSASVLNRILSANPTSIDGTLLANGRVFFVNPAGVIIGGGARINVNQLVASGLNISNDSFLNGQYEFVGGSGTVASYGDISARSVYLVGKQVTNAGNISCPDGYVVMAAGDRVFLGQPGSSVIVEIGSLEPPDQADTQSSVDITNEGTVKAAGGTIILAVAGDAFSRPIMTNTGSLSTSNAKGDAGNISFQASDGHIDNAGTITATSDSGVGGIVTANASEVVNTGTVDASGAQGGTVSLDATGRLGQFGTIDTGGIESDGGEISLTAGSGVVLGTDSLTTANAGANGDGGSVIVFSPKAALFQPGSKVEAKGGSQSGDGGFLEVSGHEYVEVEGQIDLTATNGVTGDFLIDPRNIDVLDVTGPGDEPPSWGWGDWDDTTGEWVFLPGDNSKLRMVQLEYYLDQSNITITTVQPLDNDEGNVIFHHRPLTSGLDPTNPSNNSLNVIANNDIIFNSVSGINFTGSGNLTLDAGHNVDINGNINLNSGDFTSTGIGFDNTGGAIITSDGTVNIDHTGAVTIGAPIDTTGVAGSGSVEIAGSSITVNDNITAGENITFHNAVIAAGANPLQAFDAGGTLMAMEDIIKTTSGELLLNSGGGVLHIGHDVKGTNLAGSSITFAGDVLADGDDGSGGRDQQFSATGNLTVNGDIEKSTTGTLTLGDSVGTLFLGHNVRGTNPAGSNIVLNGYIIANGVDDNAEQEFYATGNLITNNDIEKSTVGTLTLGCDNGVLYLGHNVKGTHADGSSITFNGDIIANGTGTNSEQIFDATGILTANGNIEKSTAGTLTLGNGSGTLYLGHNITTGADAGSNITFADSIIANGAGASSEQQFSAAGILTANGTIEKNTAGSLALSGGTLIDLNGAVNVQDGDLNLLDGVVVASGVKLSAGRDVILANSKTLTGEGILTVEADRNIMLGGDTLAGDLILTADRDNSGDIDGGTMHAMGTITATDGDIVVSASDDTIILDGNVHADVTDDGDILLNNNTFLADGVALWAGRDIILANGKSMTGDGELILIADYDEDSDGIIRLGGNVMGDGIIFGDSTIVRNNSVIADGTDPDGQIFNAGTGVLKVNGTITKTGTGNLTLSGGILVDLDGKVQVGYGDLLIIDTVDAEADLQASGSITLNGIGYLAGDVTGNGITFDNAVTADGDSAQSFDATKGTLLAGNTITKTTAGNLTLGGDTDIDLHGTVEVQDGSLFIEDDFHASADLLASQDITFAGSLVNGELDGIGDQRIDAQTGRLTANGWLHKGDGSLYLEAAGDISLADYVKADSGGVSIISENGEIFTPGGDTLNIAITGSSDGTTGVDLAGGGKAAIMIISKDTLKLGPGAEMTANGTYDITGTIDDRPRADFLSVIVGDKDPGWPLDISIYLASNAGNVNISSPIQPISNGSSGVMVIDAYQTVEEFGEDFIDSLDGIYWLEVCSRITPTLNYAQANHTLPYADDLGSVLDNGTSKYVLRGEGEYPDVGPGAWVLGEGEEEKPSIPKRTPMEAEATATSMPASPEISDIGQIESTVSSDLQWLGEELGLCEGDQQGEDDNRCQEITQAYLAGAFLQASDMRPQQAAAQLRQLAGLLHDTDGSRIAALGRVINEFAQPDVPPSPEQFASIGQAFAIHVNDGTHYATAKQWLDALVEYTMLLISEIGWSPDDSVAFVMSKYGPTVTEAGDVGVVAFIQMHLEDIIG